MPDRPAQFRYGAVFSLVLALAVFVIAAPSATWSRSVALAIEGAALVVAVATARERKEIRYRNALIVGVATIVLIGLVDTGTAPRGFTDAANAIITAAIPVVIVQGVFRLLRERGVTAQAVAGALAMYIAVGLVFAWIIGFVTHVSSTPYFAQHTERHGRRPGLLQLHRADDHRLRRLLRRDSGRARHRGDRDAHRAALPRHRHRSSDRQLRQPAGANVSRAPHAVPTPDRSRGREYTGRSRGQDDESDDARVRA